MLAKMSLPLSMCVCGFVDVSFHNFFEELLKGLPRKLNLMFLDLHLFIFRPPCGHLQAEGHRLSRCKKQTLSVGHTASDKAGRCHSF